MSTSETDYLADRLADLENHMIDPKEFGRLESEVNSLRRDLSAITETLKDMTRTLKEVQETLSEAKGGWRLMLAVGGAVGSLAAGLGWAAQHIKWQP